MDHEREVLMGVAQARNSAMNARTMGEKNAAEGELSNVLTRFFAVAENYPQLQANQNFLALQEELISTENKIAFARQYYNDEVMQYNTKIEQFPANTIAGMFGFKDMAPFETTNPSEREAPTVSFKR
jgi:LemA protein